MIAYILVMHYKEPKRLTKEQKPEATEEENKDAETGEKAEEEETKEEPAKPVENDKEKEEPKLHPLMDPNCSHLGVSFMGHKKCENAT